jgi:hypothetical protein
MLFLGFKRRRRGEGGMAMLSQLFFPSFHFCIISAFDHGCQILLCAIYLSGEKYTK